MMKKTKKPKFVEVHADSQLVREIAKAATRLGCDTTELLDRCLRDGFEQICWTGYTASMMKRAQEHDCSQKEKNEMFQDLLRKVATCTRMPILQSR